MHLAPYACTVIIAVSRWAAFRHGPDMYKIFDLNYPETVLYMSSAIGIRFSLFIAFAFASSWIGVSDWI